VRVVAVRVEQGSNVVVLQPDPGGILPGRGAHLHPTAGCLALALRRKAFVRALRLPGPADAAAVAAYVADQTGKRDRPTSFAERADRRDDSSMSN